MIALNVFQEILVENQKELQCGEQLKRTFDLPVGRNCLLAGVRRAGKSTLLYQHIQELLKNGQTWDDLLYVNFEDDRLIGCEASDLNRILEAQASISKARPDRHKPVLFLDEIQTVPGWDKFARRLADQEYSVFITGSNAKMLSVDVAASLGGRYLTVTVNPFSFKEMLELRGVRFDAKALLSTTGRAAVEKTFREYLTYGGFPEVIREESKRARLTSIYQKIYLGDIVARNNLANSRALRVLLLKTAESVGEPLSFSQLADITAAAGESLSKNTVINYMGFACDAFLLKKLGNYAGKLTGRQTKPKYYFADTGLLSVFLSDPLAKQLENLVALALMRDRGDEESIYFYRQGTTDVDFYDAATNTAIQVAVQLSNSPATQERETQALVRLSKHLKCSRRLILTMNEEMAVETEAGPVEVLPVWKWLLAEGR